MDYISTIIDSIHTSLNMKIFKNKEDALFSHIYNSKLVKMPFIYIIFINFFDCII